MEGDILTEFLYNYGHKPAQYNVVFIQKLFTLASSRLGIVLTKLGSGLVKNIMMYSVVIKINNSSVT